MDEYGHNSNAWAPQSVTGENQEQFLHVRNALCINAGKSKSSLYMYLLFQILAFSFKHFYRIVIFISTKPLITLFHINYNLKVSIKHFDL